MLYGIFGCQCAGGDERARTADPLLAKQVLSQLSYIPWDTEVSVLYSDTISGVSLRMRILRSAGGASDLEA